MQKLEKLYKRRGQLEKEMIDLFNAGADSEDGVMDQDQRSRFDEVREMIDRLDKDIEAGEEIQKREMEEVPDEMTPEEEEMNRMTPGNRAQFSRFGDQLMAVRKAATPGGATDQRLLQRAEGLNEGVPSEGGFLVQQDFSGNLIQRVYETGVLLNRCRRIPISANAKGLKINGVDESSRESGSRWGGVEAFWLEEAGEKTATKPKFRQVELNLKKLIAMYYATDEILEDAQALEDVAGQAFSEEIGWKIDDAIFRGDGIGKPRGILNSPALVTVDPEAGQGADTLEFENIVKMWSRMWGRSRSSAVWFVNQDVEPELYTMSLAVGTGGIPVYMPAGGASATPYATLLGRPIIPIEQASSLGTEGDITLLDLSQYVAIDKGGVQSASSIHVRFVYDETAFRFVYRVDGESLWNQALTPAHGNNTLSPFVSLGDRN